MKAFAFLVASAALSAIAALAAACHPQAEASSPPAAPPGQAWLAPERARSAGITVTPVAVAELDRVLAASGRVAFDDRRVSHVFSPVNGRVTRLVAQPGQRVRKGEALAIIESPDLGSAVSDFAKARAALAQAERELQRQKELFAAHAAAQRDLEGAESSAGQARAELARAEEKARLLGGGKPALGVTQAFTLRAPIDGEVIARAVNPGVEVQGQYSGGTAVELYTVGELDQVWVIADVFEVDLPRVKAGAPVEVEVVAFPGRKFPGRVDWIASSLDPATRTARVRCAFANPDRALKPEMYASVAIHVPGHRALAIPRGAVLRQGEQTVVFREIGVAPDGRLEFERWPVKVDDEGNESSVAVLGGLKPGDRVVTSGGIILLGMI
ncbi:MAG TPA: efflux RND transporter periplasmic adaptor subunit [Thermoanaerobaculia bacterium]|nr:efflux RND transporter periplasmic adaptor subunit [Thermoanaerobaculia bacterium]